MRLSWSISVLSPFCLDQPIHIRFTPVLPHLLYRCPQSVLILTDLVPWIIHDCNLHHVQNTHQNNCPPVQKMLQHYSVTCSSCDKPATTCHIPTTSSANLGLGGSNPHFSFYSCSYPLLMLPNMPPLCFSWAFSHSQLRAHLDAPLCPVPAPVHISFIQTVVMGTYTLCPMLW